MPEQARPTTPAAADQRAGEGTPLPVLQDAERLAREAGEDELAGVFRLAAMNLWAYGPPCENAPDCDDTLCEYQAPIIALAHARLRPSQTSREDFCSDLGPHLADALEAIGIEDVDYCDGRALADTVYCLGYRKQPTSGPDGKASDG